MNNLSEARPEYLSTLATVEGNTARLLPLLSLLETPEQPDRLAQLLEMLGLILDTQHQHAIALKTLIEKVDRLPRR
ncbi:hypothetical protein EGT36_21085 [Agrobacterium sp. FDAARGOS_525]|uniref:hypothetical protein n=1 Tax=Agrobacterium sp. FDAARGOS_525 TaxID=2420311 RepID=UPI000F67D105|nr:hypothetical protein [Agrobacterium sp. FDAARGOS_525]RSC31178.1 hypothetical protein EGT36_21085 [Agrobacterium sp. FDAARGOS_525]